MLITSALFVRMVLSYSCKIGLKIFTMTNASSMVLWYSWSLVSTHFQIYVFYSLHYYAIYFSCYLLFFICFSPLYHMFLMQFFLIVTNTFSLGFCNHDCLHIIEISSKNSLWKLNNEKRSVFNHKNLSIVLKTGNQQSAWGKIYSFEMWLYWEIGGRALRQWRCSFSDECCRQAEVNDWLGKDNENKTLDGTLRKKQATFFKKIMRR